MNGRAWNSTMPARKTPMRAKKPWQKGGKIDRKAVTTPKNRTPMKRVGKRTAAWDSLRAKMKPEFERAGITTCELQLAGCWRDNGLGFAHLKKRRFLRTEEELREACLLCNHCHSVVEAKPHDEMESILRKVILGRSVTI